MAGVADGEQHLKTLLLERKHKPGRKLLMCGNARCNLTTNISEARLLEMYGEPVSSFLRPAIRAFTPSGLQRWFAENGLKTVVKKGNRVYPHTERASDVLHLFLDLLREKQVSLACSAPVEQIKRLPQGGFRIHSANFSVESKFLLLATGGVSYPKTGSVGDGQNWAQQLGHHIESYRPGLVGFEVAPQSLQEPVGTIFSPVRLHLLFNGKPVAETRGTFEVERWGAGGTALTDASRVIARKQLSLKKVVLEIHLPDGSIRNIKPLRTRPIKEAMVTVGGVSLQEINPKTMESKKCPGLYFSGEMLDIDGPTGGYNLHAAFATAYLAVKAIVKRKS